MSTTLGGLNVADYAAETIEEIYQEGEIDIVFFGQLLCYVGARQLGDGESVLYDKTPDQCMKDAVELAEFLISTGDFYAHRGKRHEDGSFSYLPFLNGFSEFTEFVWQQFRGQWIDDFDLFITTSLVKILPGKKPPVVPEEIAALISGS